MRASLELIFWSMKCSTVFSSSEVTKSLSSYFRSCQNTCRAFWTAVWSHPNENMHDWEVMLKPSLLGSDALRRQAAEPTSH